MEERRIGIDEEFEQMFRELDQEGLSMMMFERKRQALERRRERAHQELEEEMRALEEEVRNYWADRHRGEMDRHVQEWEEEQQRRREEEGEHFDEEAYEFERGMMERRFELEERRIGLEEEFEQRIRDLDEEGLPGMMYERKREALERRKERRHQALEEEIHALEEEMHRYWEERHGGDDGGDMEHDEDQGDGGPDGHTDDEPWLGDPQDEGDEEERPWPMGPNSVRLVVASIDDGQVVVEVEIVDANPIDAWKVQINFDQMRSITSASIRAGSYAVVSCLLIWKATGCGNRRWTVGEKASRARVTASWLRFGSTSSVNWPTRIGASDLHLEGATDDLNLETGPVTVGN